MSAYNPFGVDLAQLPTADLAVLRTVNEGWYVEYKSEAPNAASIAKSVSAFANTYGGWLFYGVKEKSKSEPVAGEFVGVAREDADAALQKIRQACANAINPTPHFEIKALWGPEPDIGLAEDRCVICLEIPMGQASPYIHSSGMIYRRVGDGSEPKPETDRVMLEQLWKRPEEIRKEYRRWINTDLELSKSEAEQPFVRIFITPDLWRDRFVWTPLTTAKVREIFNAMADDDTLLATPFDTVYRTAAGFVGRQVVGNDPQRLSATWFLRENLTSEIVIPLSVIADCAIEHLSYRLEGYENAEAFARALSAHGHNRPKIVDLNFLFNTLVGVFNIQDRLDAQAGRTGPLWVKCELINVWRARPFVDVEQVVAYQAEHGVPVCLQRRVLAPSGTEPDSFAFVGDYPGAKPMLRKIYQAINTFDPIAAAFGIETGWDFDSDADGHRPVIHHALLEAGKRAAVAQDARNRRAARER